MMAMTTRSSISVKARAEAFEVLIIDKALFPSIPRLRVRLVVVVPPHRGVRRIEENCRRHSLNVPVTENDVAVPTMPQGIFEIRRMRTGSNEQPIAPRPEQHAADFKYPLRHG